MAQEESPVENLEPSSVHQTNDRSSDPIPIDQTNDRISDPSSIDQTNDRSPDPSPVDSFHSDPSLSRNISSSRLNAGAPEFVPRNSNRTDLQQPRLAIQQPSSPIHVFPVPNSPFCVPYQNFGGFTEHEVVQAQVPNDVDQVASTPNGLSEEVCNKILNQVEYYFSDANLATTDHLIRFINKDPEGFVPISVVASFKKIKALVSGPPQLATVLRNSSKLVVSDDGKKVRRLQLLTESDIEDLQSRIIVAENLPEDHSYQNLLRIFSVVGSVKTIRTCQPQGSNGGAASSRLSKIESMLFSNKLHAFVEYETVELAEKAVAELNDEGNWRSGLRVRLLLKRSTKSVHARSKKAVHEADGKSEIDDVSTSEQSNDKHPDDHSEPSDRHEHTVEENAHEKEGGGGTRRNRGRGRGKGRGRGQHHNNRGNHVGTPPSNAIQLEPTTTKQPPGPRMPDGTRGFTMGRGKPITSNNA